MLIIILEKKVPIVATLKKSFLSFEIHGGKNIRTAIYLDYLRQVVFNIGNAI